jgi:hypothetical protein
MKITQKQIAFYLLHREQKSGEYIPTWRFIGEIDIIELGRCVMASYKCPTRLTDLFQENPTMLERKYITGKSGAKYYGYRIRVGVTPEDIKDPKIAQFRRDILAGRGRHPIEVASREYSRTEPEEMRGNLQTV